jgi:hypothetical protein
MLDTYQFSVAAELHESVSEMRVMIGYSISTQAGNGIGMN